MGLVCERILSFQFLQDFRQHPSDDIFLLSAHYSTVRQGRGEGKGVSLVYDLGILSGIQVPLVLDYAYYYSCMMIGLTYIKHLYGVSYCCASKGNFPITAHPTVFHSTDTSNL